MKYIYSVEGLTGLYRGLGMKIVSHSVGTLVYDQMTKMLDENDKNSDSKDTNENDVQIFVRKTSKEITARCWAVVVSHPFHGFYIIPFILSNYQKPCIFYT